MQYIKEFTVDLSGEMYFNYITATQGDENSRFVKITVVSGGLNFLAPEGATAVLRCKKPDGTFALNDAQIEEDGTITAELTENMLAAVGNCRCEVTIYDGESSLTTVPFIVKVTPGAVDPQIESTDEYQALTKALSEVQKVDGVAKSALETATDALNKMSSVEKDIEAHTQAAEAATERANTAAGTATAAAEAAEKVNIAAEQTPTGVDITVTDRKGEQTTVHIDTLLAVDSWADIRNAVRLGLGEKLFPPGYEFTTVESDTGATIVWAVRGHDKHKAANDKLTHTMTIEAKYAYGDLAGTYKGVVFDAPEALYSAPNELPAGTYHFTIANQVWYKADNNKDYQFTLTKAVPAGGQIFLAATYDQAAEGKAVRTYASPDATDAIESVTATEGSEGTSLGKTDGTENTNYYTRIPLGSNNYAQSAVRQWLNSDAAAGSVWKPTNKFDRAPSWATTYNGFMHGLPADFLEVVQAAAIPCRTNSVCEIASLDGTEFTINQVYTLEDKFFLLSRPEIYGSWDNASYKDGELLPYYDGLTNAEKIKRDAAGTARTCWLRSPDPKYAHHARNVYHDGSFNDYSAHYDYAVAPACIIA